MMMMMMMTMTTTLSSSGQLRALSSASCLQTVFRFR